MRPAKTCCTESSASLKAGTSVDNSSEIYACPMHPQVAQRAPGSCPICGMVLQPKKAIIESSSDPELRQITGGTLNGNGNFVICATRVGSETLLAQIVQRVSEAQYSRPAIQQMVDRVAQYFVPAVVLIAMMTFIVWATIGHQPRLSYALLNAVAVLIIACPCALRWLKAICAGSSGRGTSVH